MWNIETWANTDSCELLCSAKHHALALAFTIRQHIRATTERKRLKIHLKNQGQESNKTQWWVQNQIVIHHRGKNEDCETSGTAVFHWESNVLWILRTLSQANGTRQRLTHVCACIFPQRGLIKQLIEKKIFFVQLLRICFLSDTYKPFDFAP